MNLPYFAYSLTCWWTFSLFLPWAVENSAVMNIGVQLNIWTSVLNSFYVCLGVELPKRMIITFLYFWENAEVLHTLTALFYISASKVGVPISAHFCQHLLFVFIIDFPHVHPVCLKEEVIILNPHLRRGKLASHTWWTAECLYQLFRIFLHSDFYSTLLIKPM